MKPSKRGTIAALITAIILGCLSLLIPSPASAAPYNFTYHPIHNWHSNMCISFTSQYYCDGNAAVQQWREVLAPDGSVELRTAFAGRLCLTVYTKENNAPLGLADCGQGKTQLFRKVDAPVGGGFYQLVSRHSGKCVTILSESMQPWAQLVQYACDPYSSQVDPIGAGYWNSITPIYIYNRVHNWHSNMCITAHVTGAGYGLQDSCSDNTYQQWREVSVDGGYVQLHSAGMSGACLEVTDGSLADNQPLSAMPCKDGAREQLFRKVDAPVGGGFYQLVALHSEKCVTILSESMQPGAQLVQYACNPNSSEVDRIGAGYWNTV